MMQTFKAWLKGNHLEWIDKKPEFGDRTIQVQVKRRENLSLYKYPKMG